MSMEKALPWTAALVELTLLFCGLPQPKYLNEQAAGIEEEKTICLD